MLHRVESLVTMSAAEETTWTIGSQVSQVWDAFEINLISQGMSAGCLGFELVIMGTEERFLQHYMPSEMGCGLRRQ